MIKPPILTATALPDDYEVKPGGIVFMEMTGTLKEMVRQFVLDRYWFCDGDVKRTAKSLGINMVTMRRKLRDYGVL